MTTSNATMDNAVPEGITTNNAVGSSATVGAQARDITDSTVNVNVGQTELPPPEKYRIGVNYLHRGIPTKARELINEAIIYGYDNDKVRFHWILAMLSGQSYRELSTGELAQLRNIRETATTDGDDKWERGLHTLCGLLDYLADPQGDPGPILTKLLELEDDQRTAILKHLDLVLTGTIKDKLWLDTRDRANKARTSNERTKRAWTYFHPNPAGPRARKPKPVSITIRDQVVARASSFLFTASLGYLGWLVMQTAAPLPILAYFLALITGYLGARSGVEWCHRWERLQVKEREFSGLRRTTRSPEDGFTNRMDSWFDHYSNKYLPKEGNRQTYLADTEGIRRTLRDEVVEIYREERVKDKAVTWLVRHLISEVRNRWENGTLWEYRSTYRTDPATKLQCCLGLAVMFLASIYVINAVIRIEPVATVIATLLVLVTGRSGAAAWLRIILERRRYKEEDFEYEQRLQARKAAHKRWEKKLENRPQENEMEDWLNADKTILLDMAMRQYKLTWRDIIAHTFLQTPAKQCARKRIKPGPWRYSRYELHLFLITADGVRWVSTELDFQEATFHDEERLNFRFDAVASVNVTETEKLHHMLELNLVDGSTMTASVQHSSLEDLESDEDPEKFSQITLESAGFPHTLHILEGIAAEGKEWLSRAVHPPAHLTELAPAIESLPT